MSTGTSAVAIGRAFRVRAVTQRVARLARAKGDQIVAVSLRGAQTSLRSTTLKTVVNGAFWYRAVTALPVCRAGAGARGGVTATMTRAQVRANGNGAVLALVEDVADAGAIVAEALPGAEVREQSLVDTDRTLSIAGTCDIRRSSCRSGT